MSSLLEKELERQRRKALLKLGPDFGNEGFEIPDSSVVEQASSYLTARYTASLVGKEDIVADLTAGLGINVMAFAKRAVKVYAVEKDIRRADCLRRNLVKEEIENVEVVTADCNEWLKCNPPKFSVAYLDPARRNSRGRFYKLEDCAPNIFDLLPEIKNVSRVLVKVSPMLDITSVIKRVPQICKIHILELNHEVKEMILEIGLGETMPDSREIVCVFLKSDSDTEFIRIPLDAESADNISMSYLNGRKEILKGGYLYEPSPALMKTGRFDVISGLYPGLSKFSKDTHLFQSSELFGDFPGRIFEIEGDVGSGELKKMTGSRRNVISRNHPAKATEIEKRYRLRASDNDFLIACTAGKDKCMLTAQKIH